MHTDEYEISLSRELHVCEKKIEKIRKALVAMETKYQIKTAVFVDEYKSGSISAGNADFSAWVSNYEALKKWEVLRDQYAELLHRMKI
jgi:hypothetical protein